MGDERENGVGIERQWRRVDHSRYLPPCAAEYIIKPMKPFTASNLIPLLFKTSTTMKIPTPSSSSFCTYGYSAFLSFRGPDTSFGFTGHLSHAPRGKRLSTFMDDRETEIGEEYTMKPLKALNGAACSRIPLLPKSSTTMKNPPPSSSSLRTYGYDVFISFRGPDTRFGFTGNLSHALREKGFSTFMDDREIEIGEEITPALYKALQECRVALVIFSKNYASSSFCLAELAKIMESSKDKGTLVWPVFYQVDPSVVRHQKGSYAEALAKHEGRFGKEKTEKWRAVLKQAADQSGLHFRANGERYEHELIEDIIQEVSKKFPMPLHVADYTVGLQYRVQRVKSLLDVESSDGVHVVGIYGIDGIGKTTLARALYNSIAYKFRSVCFLEDIKEYLMNNGLLQLRDKLLCELVGEKDFRQWKRTKENPRIKSKLRQRKSLLILDGVDNLEQLKVLLMLEDVDELEQFGSGTRIIITTRVQHLLQQFGVERTYGVEPLNRDEALELFSCWSAFKTKQVNIPSYNKDISQGVIQSCYGLPLSVKMIGLGLGIGMLSKEQIISPSLFDKAVSECNSAVLDTNDKGNINYVDEE